MTTDDRIDRGRAAFARKAWSEAFDLLSAADAASPLGFDDLERLAFAAHYIGRDDVSTELDGRAYRAALDAGQPARAARGAFWIAMGFAQRGDGIQAGAWLGRLARLLEEHDLDTVERGYLAIPDGIRNVETDPATALAAFERAAAYAERFHDPDLDAMSRLGRGRSLIGLGETERGVAFLDEAMVAVTADELTPIVTGIVYCTAIEAFAEIFDLRRAQAWTQALTEWCDRQPDLIPFRGRCLVYRSELKRFHGDWSAAFDEARRAEEWLLRPPPEPAVGGAYYEQAELHRLRGEYAAAEAAYREASQWGRRPEPGLALLLLARG
jgi:tetratricopeptide (TPR) repeat protein